MINLTRLSDQQVFLHKIFALQEPSVPFMNMEQCNLSFMPL